MNEMEQFRHNADRLGLCDAFAKKWSDCKSKKQLYDLACDVNSLEYLADMIARGYGLSTDYIVSEFGQFINGRYICDNDGYTSCIYCRYGKDELHIQTTATLIIGFTGELYIDRPIAELYMVNCDCDIKGEGLAQVYLFNSNISNLNSSQIAVQLKKQYDKYGVEALN